MTIHKAFVRPHLDYGDLTYDKAYNKTNACLALSGAIRGLSREKIYQELGFESF